MIPKRHLLNSIKGLLLLLCGLVLWQGYIAPGPLDTVQRMINRTKQIQSMRFTLSKQERIRGKMVNSKNFVKIQRSPFKIYLKQLAPSSGAEVLYVTGSNNGQAMVNPNGFPWVTLNLDPMGKTMRSDQHHTIFDAGYDHVISVVEYLMNKYGKTISSMVQDNGSATFGGRDCYKIIMDNPNFTYVNYTIQKGETLLTIARKFHFNEYMALEKNPSIKFYDEVSPGQVVTIPNDYARKMLMLIDKQTLLPAVLYVYDDKGLYEQYEYSEVNTNPGFKPEEFTSTYEDYNF